MKVTLCLLSLLIVSMGCLAADQIIGGGKQPQIAADACGNIKIAFGSGDSIFCVNSSDGGLRAGQPVLVGVVPEMHLGMARGPQLACSANFSLITAMDKRGDIHAFIFSNNDKVWKKAGLVNNVRSSAPEGLMHIASDQQDHFYAVWLDTRLANKNNIFFSAFDVKTGKWRPNRLVYQSPDGHVCECCRPSIAVQGAHVAIMFRNWLLGSRDLYLIGSSDGGGKFGAAEKSGSGTWKLNACPMDGGGLVFNQDGSVSTVWRRQDNIYFSKKGQMEQNLGTGKNCSISLNNNNHVIAMTENGSVKLTFMDSGKVIEIGKGNYLKTASLPSGKIVCVWEDSGLIKTRLL